MNPSTLAIHSPVIRVRTTEHPSPYSATFDGWVLSETLGHPAHHNGGDTYWSYRVSMARAIEVDEDPGNAFISACYLAADIRHVWIYVTGLPLGDRAHDLFFSRVALPDGWGSNAPEAIPDQDLQLLLTDLPTHAIHRTWQQLPLKMAIAALAALDQADPLVLQLARYHFAAVDARELDLHYLLYSQGLEIARELLPGADDDAKQASLPAAVQSKLQRGFHWLFGIVNQRRETRHAITKRPNLALHPELDEPEGAVFTRDADLVLRAVACQRLGIPIT